MKNQKLAKLFLEMANLLEIQGVAWKPNAYRKAAKVLLSLNAPIENVYKKGGLNKLIKLEGIGRGIASKIEEFLTTNKIEEYVQLTKRFPKSVEELLSVPGLGPKKVMILFKKLNITNIQKLEATARSGELETLSGFGKKSKIEILSGLQLLKQGHKRRLLGVALPIAKRLRANLQKLKCVERVEIAGSVSRFKETVKDIDLLVVSSNPKAVMDYVVNIQGVQKVIASGKTKTSVKLADGLQVDVKVLGKKSFGSGLQYFTGSKNHNIKLRQLAIKKGFKLSEYGLFKNNVYICGKSEVQIYNKLGLQHIPKEMRENKGEIKLAAKNSLPNLISLKDIKGDLHMHTLWSDGLNSIEQMVSAAKRLGYKYIAITDHSKSERIAHGMNEKRLLQYLKALDNLQEKFGIKIFKGAEVDILKSGELDYKNKYLKKLDIVVASVHSGFKSDSKSMTKRILTALNNPCVTILGHPTGRIVNRRHPLNFDVASVFAKAKDNNVALEINSYPSRLDLKPDHIRLAKELGCAFSINTDSHAIDHLKNMELGVGQARRGWLESKDVINTKTLSNLKKFISY